MAGSIPNKNLFFRENKKKISCRSMNYVRLATYTYRQTHRFIVGNDVHAHLTITFLFSKKNNKQESLESCGIHSISNSA